MPQSADRIDVLRIARAILSAMGERDATGSFAHDRAEVRKLVTFLELFVAKERGLDALPTAIRADLERALEDPAQDLDELSAISGPLKASLMRCLSEARLENAAWRRELGPRETVSKPGGHGRGGALARLKLEDWEG